MSLATVFAILLIYFIAKHDWSRFANKPWLPYAFIMVLALYILNSVVFQYDAAQLQSLVQENVINIVTETIDGI